VRESKVAEVARLHASGMRPSEIAVSLGRTPRAIYQFINRARKSGLLESKGMELRRNSLSSGYALLQKKFNGTSRDIGSMKQILYRLTPDCLGWLADMTPDGASAADVIAGIIVDACEEDPRVVRARQRALKNRNRKLTKELGP
jgi:Winged helix-turn helix